MRELLRALAARDDQDVAYLLYARREWDGAKLDERFRWRLIGARDPWWHLIAARAANRECATFLSSNSYLTTCLLRIPSVPIVYDMVAFEPQMRPNRRSAAIERLTLAPAVRRAAALLCISQATADALTVHLPAAAGRTVVAPLGATLPPASALAPDELAALPEPGFVLAVGTLEPRKNLPRLVEAYSTLQEGMQLRHRLVVVGALGWQTGETLDALRRLGERCIMLGYISDAALAELYRRCAVFCYPSLGEGFGLPVLEAMQAGAPVITSNLSSLPEVGGQAVEYVEPTDVGSIAAALRALLQSPQRRAQLAAAGPVRATGFSWDKTAEIVLQTLTQAAA